MDMIKELKEDIEKLAFKIYECEKSLKKEEKEEYDKFNFCIHIAEFIKGDVVIYPITKDADDRLVQALKLLGIRIDGQILYCDYKKLGRRYAPENQKMLHSELEYYKNMSKKIVVFE